VGDMLELEHLKWKTVGDGQMVAYLGLGGVLPGKLSSIPGHYIIEAPNNRFRWKLPHPIEICSHPPTRGPSGWSPSLAFMRMTL
jgi:hypothetical protein